MNGSTGLVASSGHKPCPPHLEYVTSTSKTTIASTTLDNNTVSTATPTLDSGTDSVNPSTPSLNPTTPTLKPKVSSYANIVVANREASFVSHAASLISEQANTLLNEVLSSSPPPSTALAVGSIRSSGQTPTSAPKPMASPLKPRRSLGFTGPFTQEYLFMVKKAKEVALTAIKQKRTYTILGPYPYLRSSLNRRGWVEKMSSAVVTPYAMSPQCIKIRSRKKKKTTKRGNSGDDSGSDGEKDTESSAFNRVVSRLLKDIPPTFIWTLKRDDVDFRFLNRDQIINHFCKTSSFTTKLGLCQHLRSLPWFDCCDPNDFFPRCYQLYDEDDRDAFIENFHVSAAVSILKVYCKSFIGHQNNENTPYNTQNVTNSGVGEDTFISPDTPIIGQGFNVGLHNSVEFAIQHLEVVLKIYGDEFLDFPMQANDLTTSYQKKLLLLYSRALASGKEAFSSFNHDLYRRCKGILSQLDTLNITQDAIEGTGNIWIMKPGAKSRGRGVVVQFDLEEILKLANNSRDEKWVIQKYIETPLLVHRTKFDIRQWFMVTDWNPLTLYFYQDSYLRFGSKPFSLDNNDPCIHLCNNSIQKKFLGPGRKVETENFAEGNMWTSTRFKEHLTSTGHSEVWSTKIYPGMKKAIQRVMLTTQDLIEDRKNSFELYGADFMLDQNYQPWLIEINSSPAMGGTTKVTEVLCAEVLDDCLKVIIDRRESRGASTGKWELIFKQPVVTSPPYVGIQLSVNGKFLPKPLPRRVSVTDRKDRPRGSSDRPRGSSDRPTAKDRQVVTRTRKCPAGPRKSGGRPRKSVRRRSSGSVVEQIDEENEDDSVRGLSSSSHEGDEVGLDPPRQPTPGHHQPPPPTRYPTLHDAKSPHGSTKMKRMAKQHDSGPVYPTTTVRSVLVRHGASNSARSLGTAPSGPSSVEQPHHPTTTKISGDNPKPNGILPNINRKSHTSSSPFRVAATVAVHPIGCPPSTQNTGTWQVKKSTAPVSHLLRNNMNPYRVQQILSRSVRPAVPQEPKVDIITMQNKFLYGSRPAGSPLSSSDSRSSVSKVELYEIKRESSKPSVKKINSQDRNLNKYGGCPHCEPIKTNKQLFLNLIKGGGEEVGSGVTSHQLSSGAVPVRTATRQLQRPKKQFRVSLNQMATLSNSLININENLKAVNY